jgi:Excalibur calcium-binding domain
VLQVAKTSDLAQRIDIAETGTQAWQQAVGLLPGAIVPNDIARLHENLQRDRAALRKRIEREEAHRVAAVQRDAQREERKAARAAAQSESRPRSTSRREYRAASVYFRNCKQARAAGYSHMEQGTPGYRSALDRDRDGIACDSHR